MIPEIPLSSEYDRFGDFYYEFIKNGLAKEDSAFNQNATETLRLLGNVEGRQICDLACGEGLPKQGAISQTRSGFLNLSVVLDQPIGRLCVHLVSAFIP